jgi:hypothetical protein
VAKKEPLYPHVPKSKKREGKLEVELLKDEKQQVLYTAYCPACEKHIDTAPNGPMVEAAARLHVRETEHTVIVGTSFAPVIP